MMTFPLIEGILSINIRIQNLGENYKFMVIKYEKHEWVF